MRKPCSLLLLCSLAACSSSGAEDQRLRAASPCVTSAAPSGDRFHSACSFDYTFNGTDYGQVTALYRMDGNRAGGIDEIEASARIEKTGESIRIHLDETSGEVTYSSPNGDFAVKHQERPDGLWVHSQRKVKGQMEKEIDYPVSCPGLDNFVKGLREDASLKEAYYPCPEYDAYASKVDVNIENQKQQNAHQLGLAFVQTQELEMLLDRMGGPGRFVFAFTKVNAAVNATAQFGQNNYNSSWQNQGKARGRWGVQRR